MKMNVKQGCSVCYYKSCNNWNLLEYKMQFYQALTAKVASFCYDIWAKGRWSMSFPSTLHHPRPLKGSCHHCSDEPAVLIAAANLWTVESRTRIHLKKRENLWSLSRGWLPLKERDITPKCGSLCSHPRESYSSLWIWAHCIERLSWLIAYILRDDFLLCIVFKKYIKTNSQWLFIRCWSRLMVLVVLLICSVCELLSKSHTW